MTSKYDIKTTKTNENYLLTGTIYGDTYNTDIYNYKTEVKAITYHEMNIEKQDEQITIKFIVDL